MNKIEERFGWRLEKVKEALNSDNYMRAFREYSNLVRLFNCLDGYEDSEKLEFYKRVSAVGDDIFFKLAKKKILEGIKKHKYTISENKLRKIKGLHDSVCDLIKEERFEEALRRFYESK